MKSDRLPLRIDLWHQLLQPIRSAQSGARNLGINRIDNDPVSWLDYFYFNQFRASSYQTVGIRFQVSTTLLLHRTLALDFPASGNQSHQPSAGLKIQAVFELLTQRWFAFQLGPFTRTDQQAAADCLDWIKPGDLLLRDLGYAVLPIWQELLNRGAYFVSRLRSDIALFDQKGQALDLIALLQVGSLSSTQVKVGHSEQIPLRLVALKLPPNLAAQRRRRARANAKRDRRLRLTRRYLKLQDWTVLVTNVEQKTWSAQQVLEA